MGKRKQTEAEAIDNSRNPCRPNSDICPRNSSVSLVVKESGGPLIHSQGVRLER